MFKTIKNQKGITLVELLAVMVIVGIIAAISIPAIGNLIENTRKDAVVATAKNLQESARLVAAQNDLECASGCVINFKGAGKTEIDGSAYIENLETGVDKAVVTVGNDGGGKLTYSTNYTTDKYTLAEGDAFAATRDDVTQND